MPIRYRTAHEDSARWAGFPFRLNDIVISSLYHHYGNLDTERIRQLAGQPTSSGSQSASLPPAHEWMLAWIDQDPLPQEKPDSLPGVMWHLADAWSRRSQRRNSTTCGPTPTSLLKARLAFCAIAPHSSGAGSLAQAVDC
jgi:hypothetical protein